MICWSFSTYMLHNFKLWTNCVVGTQLCASNMYVGLLIFFALIEILNTNIPNPEPAPDYYPTQTQKRCSNLRRISSAAHAHLYISNWWAKKLWEELTYRWALVVRLNPSCNILHNPWLIFSLVTSKNYDLCSSTISWNRKKSIWGLHYFVLIRRGKQIPWYIWLTWQEIYLVI